MRLLGLTLVLWLGASVAQASDAPEPCAPHVELRSIQLDYRTKPGVWFDADVAKCLLEEVARAREQEGLLVDYEHRDLLSIELFDLTVRQRDLAIEEADRARTGMETAIKLKGDAERKLGAPGRSRGLWLAVGLVSGVILVGVSAYALNATQR